MSGELIAIVAVAGLIYTNLARLESQFNEWRDGSGELRERMAHLEGLLEGLREAIAGRAPAS